MMMMETWGRIEMTITHRSETSASRDANTGKNDTFFKACPSPPSVRSSPLARWTRRGTTDESTAAPVCDFVYDDGFFTVSLRGTIFYYRTKVVGLVRIHGCFGPVYMEPRVCTRSYTRLARARMRAANEWDAMGFIHSSVVDARGDGPTDAPTVKIEIDRIERVSRVSLSLASSSIDSSDEFIHSFIHSRANIRCERTNEGTKRRRDESERSRERRERRDDRRIRSRRATRGAHVSNANASNASNASNRARIIHFKRPTGDDHTKCMDECTRDANASSTGEERDARRRTREGRVRSVEDAGMRLERGLGGRRERGRASGGI